MKINLKFYKNKRIRNYKSIDTNTFDRRIFLDFITNQQVTYKEERTYWCASLIWYDNTILIVDNHQHFYKEKYNKDYNGLDNKDCKKFINLFFINVNKDLKNFELYFYDHYKRKNKIKELEMISICIESKLIEYKNIYIGHDNKYQGQYSGNNTNLSPGLIKRRDFGIRERIKDIKWGNEVTIYNPYENS